MSEIYLTNLLIKINQYINIICEYILDRRILRII